MITTTKTLLQNPSFRQEPLLPHSITLVGLNRLLDLNSFNLDEESIKSLMLKFEGLAEFAKLNRIQLCFWGLKEMRKKLEELYWRTWYSRSVRHPERDLLEFLVNLEFQSTLSPRKYNIRVKY